MNSQRSWWHEFLKNSILLGDLPTHHVIFSSSMLFRRHVLNISEGIHDMGGFEWKLILLLLLAWILTFFCLIKGIKSTGKVGQPIYLYTPLQKLYGLVQSCMWEDWMLWFQGIKQISYICDTFNIGKADFFIQYKKFISGHSPIKSYESILGYRLPEIFKFFIWI